MVSMDGFNEIAPPEGENAVGNVTIDPRIAALLEDLQQAREDIAYYLEELAQRDNQAILEKLQKLDSEIAEVSEMGEEFERLLDAGVSVEVAYCAVKAAQSGKPEQPVIGDIGGRSDASDNIFSFDEVAGMSKEQIRKNYDKVMRSTGSWKGKQTLREI